MYKLRLITGILLSAWLASSQAATVDPAMINAISKGAKLWSNNCTRCHNYRAPTEYTASQWRVIMMHMRIQAGLTSQQEQDIYAFLASDNTKKQASTENTQSPTPNATVSTTSKNKKHAQTTPTRSGRQIYNETCVACHGANGEGAVPGVVNFRSKNSPLKNSNSVLLKRIKYGYHSPGSPMAMPPKGGNPSLSDQDLKNALQYIREQFSPN